MENAEAKIRPRDVILAGDIVVVDERKRMMAGKRFKKVKYFGTNVVLCLLVRCNNKDADLIYVQAGSRVRKLQSLCCCWSSSFKLLASSRLASNEGNSNHIRVLCPVHYYY